MLEVYLKKWVGKSSMSLFILQTVQKFAETIGDALIFKCVNSVVESIFNEKIVKKWNLWVCE